MERKVEYSEITAEDNFFERMRKDEKGNDWFRPAIELVTVDGISYSYYLLRREMLSEMDIPNASVFKLVSKDPKTGKRVMLLGLRQGLSLSQRQSTATEEIKAFKGIK